MVEPLKSARTRSAMTSCSCTRHNPEREDACVRRLLSRRVDGLLIAPVYRMDPEVRIYQELINRATPAGCLTGDKICSQFVACAGG